MAKQKLSATLILIGFLFLTTPMLNLVMLAEGPRRFLISGSFVFGIWLCLIMISFLAGRTATSQHEDTTKK